MNTFKLPLLICMQVGLVATVGLALGDVLGMLVAAAVAAGVIGISSVRFTSGILDSDLVRKHDPISEGGLIDLLHQLAGHAAVATPKLYIFDHAEPNALSLGYTAANSAVIVTSGLIRLLDKEEIAAVLAHEIAHIRSRDAALMTCIAAMAGLVVGIGGILLLLGRGVRGGGGLGLIIVGVSTALSALLIRCAIGRETEYVADAAAAAICGHPEWLISALERLQIKLETSRNEPAFAPGLLPLLFIAPGRPSVRNLFASHPPIAARVARLTQLSATGTCISEREEAFCCRN